MQNSLPHPTVSWAIFAEIHTTRVRDGGYLVFANLSRTNLLQEYFIGIRVRSSDFVAIPWLQAYLSPELVYRHRTYTIAVGRLRGKPRIIFYTSMWCWLYNFFIKSRSRGYLFPFFAGLRFGLGFAARILFCYCRVQGIAWGDEDSVMFPGICCWFYRAGAPIYQSLYIPWFGASTFPDSAGRVTSHVAHFHNRMGAPMGFNLWGYRGTEVALTTSTITLDCSMIPVFMFFLVLGNEYLLFRQ